MSRPADSQVPYEPYEPLEEPPKSPFLGQTDSGSGSSTPVLQGRTLVNSDTYNAANRASEHGSLPVGGDETPRVTASQTASKVFLNQGTDDPNAAQHFKNYPLFPESTAEKQELFEAPRSKSKSQTKRKGLIWGIVAALLIAVIIAVVIPVYLLVVKKSNSSGNGSGSGGGGGHNGDGHSGGDTSTPGPPTSGGDGSVVTKEDGTTFIYNNTFGGFWVWDSANPLNESAQAQSYTPPIGQEWKWGVDKMYGVNLGGWLTLEPFISPALYQPFDPNAVDEWSLSQFLQQRDGNLNAIEEHYKTFIVEEDFAAIAAAGLNWVRIPLPFWAIETYDGEPMLERVCWTYFLKAIQWGRKYGIRINLDFHAVPGSQNGWNHSGKLASNGFLNGVMGLANAQRTLNYIRIIAEFISQPEYTNVVPFFGIINEPYAAPNGVMTPEAIKSFYTEVYTMIRGITGIGAGKGPYISINEAFQGMSSWAGFLQGADRVALDFHPYFVFGPQSAGPVESFVPLPCQNWAQMFGTSMGSFGMTAAGEWSFAINDCGLYLNDVQRGSRYDGSFAGSTAVGTCDQWNDYTTWTPETKAALKQLGLTHMDALQNWFFWTWKIGESTSGRIETPFWSYKLGLEQGWAPTDPRQSVGACAAAGGPTNPWTDTSRLQSWQLGGTGAGEVPSLNQFPWPPSGLVGSAQYTPTGSLITLPVPTFTQSPTATASMGNGWADASDNAPLYTPIAGCAYPDPWGSPDQAAPACAMVAQKRDAMAEPAPTPAPAPL